MPPLVLGIDLGTNSVKVCIVDTCNREVIEQYCEANDSTVLTDVEGRHEQLVPKIVDTLNTCISKLSPANRRKINRIGVCGQMHGIMFWNTELGGKPWQFKDQKYIIEEKLVSTLYTKLDRRCDSEFLSKLPKSNSHVCISAGFGIPTIFWLKKYNPRYLKTFNRSGLISTFVVTMLCDHEIVCTSYQNAASWGYFSYTQRDWELDLLVEEDFPTHLLPKVIPSGELVGALTQDWYGIPSGVPVGVDLGDSQCFIASTLESPRDALITICSSMQITFVVDNYLLPKDPTAANSITYWPYFDNQYLVICTSKNGGSIMNYFVDMLCSWINDLGKSQNKEKVWERLIFLGLQNNSESNLKIKPTCLGENFDPKLLASVSNVTGLNVGLGQIFRALCRGLAENLLNILSKDLLEHSKIGRILINGQDLYKNKVLMDECERVFEIPFDCGGLGEASKGAAIAVHIYGKIKDCSKSNNECS